MDYSYKYLSNKYVFAHSILKDIPPPSDLYNLSGCASPSDFSAYPALEHSGTQKIDQMVPTPRK